MRTALSIPSWIVLSDYLLHPHPSTLVAVRLALAADDQGRAGDIIQRAWAGLGAHWETDLTADMASVEMHLARHARLSPQFPCPVCGSPGLMILWAWDSTGYGDDADDCDENGTPPSWHGTPETSVGRPLGSIVTNLPAE